MTTQTRHPKAKNARLGFQDLDDACLFVRYAAHEVAGLYLDIDESGTFPLVILGTSSKTACELFEDFIRGGKERQQERDAAESADADRCERRRSYRTLGVE